MTELKPCPFCGSAMVQCYACFGIIEPSKEPMYWTAECTTCGSQIYKPTETEAIAAWNTRHPDADLVEALKVALNIPDMILEATKGNGEMTAKQKRLVQAAEDTYNKYKEKSND